MALNDSRYKIIRDKKKSVCLCVMCICMYEVRECVRWLIYCLSLVTYFIGTFPSVLLSELINNMLSWQLCKSIAPDHDTVIHAIEKQSPFLCYVFYEQSKEEEEGNKNVYAYRHNREGVAVLSRVQPLDNTKLIKYALCPFCVCAFLFVCFQYRSHQKMCFDWREK